MEAGSDSASRESDGQFASVQRQFASVHLHIEQTRIEMRDLHEDLVERIVRIGERESKIPYVNYLEGGGPSGM
jgi:hypothetical protein